MSERPRSEFEPVETPGEAVRLLREASKGIASAMIWSKEQKYVVNTHVGVFQEVEKILYAAIPRDIDPRTFMQQLDDLGSRDCFFSLSLTRANLFFKATCLGYDDGGLRFRAPEQIFKVQRRKDMRFTIPEGYTLRVEIPNPINPAERVTKAIVDISSSGLAFVITPEEESVYRAGMILGSASVILKLRKLVADVEIKHVRAIPTGSSRHRGVKVGVLFTNLPADASAWISAYVFEESRKFISRFIGG